MKIFYNELKILFTQILVNEGFTKEKAAKIATTFADTTLDGVYSHGINRFPVFVDYIREGLINISGEPSLIETRGLIERYDGNLGPGILNAGFCMERSIALATENGISCVAIKNTNHWMRGGTYGWQAASAGCIGICFTNTIANLPPWGSIDPRLGNNPLVIAVPKKDGHLVLDMAMTQFSFGKLDEYELRNEQLPVPGGYDKEGKLSYDPATIKESKRTLPVGFWKGSGLALMLDLLVTILSKGSSSKSITESGKESGVSQVFICINNNNADFGEKIAKEIISYCKSGTPEKEGGKIYYPGERTLITRTRNLEKGIPVSDEILHKIKMLL